MSQIGVFTESEDFPGEWSGGVRNASMRFIGVTVPQGATITSAKITFTRNSGTSNTYYLKYKFVGVAEDNTGEFATSPVDDGRTRNKTSAIVTWDKTLNPGSIGDLIDSPDLSTIIQEIVNRGGWSSGNAIGIYLYDYNTSVSNFLDIKYYSSYPNDTPLLTITYNVGSPSVSPSASVSPSISPSASTSPSASASSSISSSASSSPSPSPMPPAIPAVLKIAKSGVNVLTNSDIEKLKFSSEYGTLKYSSKQTSNLQIDASAGDIAAHGTITHNLNKYPFVEVFVSVYIGSPTGVYEYCPFLGAGASVFYKANVKITKTTIELYAEINGVSSSLWHFDFLVFIFNNDLNL